MPGGRFLSETDSAVFEALMQESRPCLPSRERTGMAVSCFFCRSDGKRSDYHKILKNMWFRIPDHQFNRRVEEMLSETDGSVYRDKEHERRFKNLVGHRQILAMDKNPSYAAALYLLSADGYLWGKAQDAITMSQVLFEDIQLGGINVRGYILFHLAKDLYFRSECVKISDLTDRSLVDRRLFAVLLTGCFIREHGLGVVEQTGMV